jgi:hypothetical protein
VNGRGHFYIPAGGNGFLGGGRSAGALGGTGQRSASGIPRLRHLPALAARASGRGLLTEREIFHLTPCGQHGALARAGIRRFSSGHSRWLLMGGVRCDDLAAASLAGQELSGFSGTDPHGPVAGGARESRAAFGVHIVEVKCGGSSGHAGEAPEFLRCIQITASAAGQVGVTPFRGLSRRAAFIHRMKMAGPVQRVVAPGLLRFRGGRSGRFSGKRAPGKIGWERESCFTARAKHIMTGIPVIYEQSGLAFRAGQYDLRHEGGGWSWVFEG